MSYANVEAAVPESVNIVFDPPRVLDMDLARQHVAALDRLPRPTLVTCRTGARSSAVVYLYAGLRAGAAAERGAGPRRSRRSAVLRQGRAQGLGGARARRASRLRVTLRGLGPCLDRDVRGAVARERLPFQPLQRSRNVMPASWAMRSSSAGQT